MKKTLLLSMVALLASCGGSGDGGAISTLASGAASSGNSGANTPSTPSTTAQGTSAPDTSNLPVASTDFLIRAYQDAIGEIALSQLAAQRTSNAGVRRYAQMMVADHTNVNTLIARVAQTQNITLPTQPTDEQTNLQNKLSALSGADFDRAYLEQSVTGHQQDILLFLRQAQGGTDEQVRQFAIDGLPLLQTHLAMTEELYASIDPAAYLMIAYRHGLAEIQLSQLALDKASADYIKPFAQMLIDHHTEINRQISELAAQENITLPTAPSDVETAVRDDLARLSGSDFDKAYASVNVVVHTGDVNATTAQSQNSSDQAVRTLAAATLPRLSDHLRMSQEIYQSVDASFLVRAEQNNAGEILLAVRALESASDASVRAFAQRMIVDHFAANNQVVQLAAQEGVPLPRLVVPAEFFVQHHALSTLSGADFDRTYISDNVDAHTTAVAVFTNFANNAQDQDQRALAAQALPTLQSHLQEATQILASLPGGNSGGGGTPTTGTPTTGTPTTGTPTTGTPTTGTPTTGTPTTGTPTTGTPTTGTPSSEPSGTVPATMPS